MLRMKINYFIKYWTPVIFYMGFIYYFSSLTNPLEEIIPAKALIYFDFERFIYHAIEYLILSFLLYRALKINTKNPQTLAILITIAYAITDEIHQYFVPGRTPSIFDIAIDSFGAVSMQCIINVYNWIENTFKN